MPNTVCYLIECLTNLHAGSGDTGVGIIDKMVQRDPVTTLPVIYASSLKGAFREYFEEGPESAALRAGADKIFGPKNNDDDPNKNNGRGSHVFHEAQLLALPLGSNQAPYYMATSKLNLQHWLNKAKLLLATIDDSLEKEVQRLPDVAEGKPKILGAPVNRLYISDFENVGNDPGNFTKLNALLGSYIVLLHHNDFKEQCSDYNLPVIARNNLENGESKNLWYEQIVPHGSIFGFFTYTSQDETEDAFLKNICNKVVQIGANSSLGYGYCKIKTL